jgi:glyoxylase I family protein
MLKSIHHAAIICSDYKTSKQFYVSILGLEIVAEQYRKDRNSFKLDLKLPNGNQLEIFSFPDSPDRPSYPEALCLRHLAFTVASVESFTEYLVSKNIDVEAIRVDEYTNRKYTFFRDPDGLPLELYEETNIAPVK